jgi:hypothetical protein
MTKTPEVARRDLGRYAAVARREAQPLSLVRSAAVEPA